MERPLDWVWGRCDRSRVCREGREEGTKAFVFENVIAAGVVLQKVSLPTSLTHIGTHLTLGADE
jgi:hypothetical protein